MSARVKAAGAADRTRSTRILGTLALVYPDARTALLFSSPLECLVATVLSAQCTDARVNRVTRGLFKLYRSAKDYADAPREKLEREILPTGFFRSKARSIQGLATAIVRDHGGEVPSTMEELVELPGVGRKTANLVLGESFGITTGIVVDTHVARVSGRLGLTRHEDPVKIEQDLMAIVPRKDWIAFGMRMILHGRQICVARRPLCHDCPLLPDCPSGPGFMKSGVAAKPRETPSPAPAVPPSRLSGRRRRG